MKKLDHSIYSNFIIGLSKRNKGQDKRMLHLDLIYEDILASRVYVRVKQKRSWDWAEYEHVQEDEKYEEKFKPLTRRKWEDLVIRIRVVTSCDVDNEYHLLKAVVVTRIIIVRNPFRLVYYYASDQPKSYDYDRFEDEEDEELTVCEDKCLKGSLDLWDVEYWQHWIEE